MANRHYLKSPVGPLSVCGTHFSESGEFFTDREDFVTCPYCLKYLKWPKAEYLGTWPRTPAEMAAQEQYEWNQVRKPKSTFMERLQAKVKERWG